MLRTMVLVFCVISTFFSYFGYLWVTYIGTAFKLVISPKGASALKSSESNLSTIDLGPFTLIDAVLPSTTTYIFPCSVRTLSSTLSTGIPEIVLVTVGSLIFTTTSHNNIANTRAINLYKILFVSSFLILMSSLP